MSKGEHSWIKWRYGFAKKKKKKKKNFFKPQKSEKSQMWTVKLKNTRIKLEKLTGWAQ